MLVDPGGHSGAENMAADTALLHDADASGAAFLRLYRWTPSCLSFGRHEPAAARYDRAAIERLGLDVVRRPTGGRAVWHEHEVTYAVAAPVAIFGSLRDGYREIHQRLAEALRRLGAVAALAPANGARAGGIGPAKGGACFASAAGGEVLVEGHKVIGSAQVRHGTALLQHGSILLDGSQDVIRAVSRRPSAAHQATTLSAVLGRWVGFQEVVEAIVGAWGTPFTALPHPSPPFTAFSDPAWTWRR